MSNPSDFPGANGPFIDIDELRAAGREVSDEVDVPDVFITDYVLDDNDTQECRYATEDEIRPMYIDNPIAASPVQPDLVTLAIADEYLTFNYHNGLEYTVRIGDIDINRGPSATRYYKSGGLVYPTDDAQNVLLNATTTPRIAAVYAWMDAELQRRSEERLRMAELIANFAMIIAHADTLGPLHM